MSYHNIGNGAAKKEENENEAIKYLIKNYISKLDIVELSKVWANCAQCKHCVWD